MGRYRNIPEDKSYWVMPYAPSCGKRDIANIRINDYVFHYMLRIFYLADLLQEELFSDVSPVENFNNRFLYIILIPFFLTDFIIGKVIALLSLLDAEFDADHIREKRKRTSGSGGQFFRLIFSKYSKLILPFSFR